MLLQALWVTVSAVACTFLILRGVAAIGDCADVAARSREVFAESLAGILALLMAARPPGGGADGRE